MAANLIKKKFIGADQVDGSQILLEVGQTLRIKDGVGGEIDLIARIDADIASEASARAAADSALQSELDATQAGAGLGTDGSYVQNGSANYIAAATSLSNADDLLDAQIAANAAAITSESSARAAADSAIQSELDATQAGAGLGTDGSYSANGSANFISGATSLKSADDLLDTALKAEETARIAAIADLSGVTDAVTARSNLSVYSIAEVQAEIQNASLNLGTNFSTADATAAATDFPAGSLTVGDNIFVIDDGDTKWAIYKVTAITDGAYSTSTLTKIMDEDVYLNAQSAAAIKSAYESNADTNAFSDEEQARVARVGSSSTVLTTTSQEILGAINELDAAIDALGSGNLAAIQSELDATQAGAGLETDGTYSANGSANYISAATSLKDADNLLDAQIAVNTAAIAQEVIDRAAADTTLQSNIDAEAAARVAADDAEEAARIAADLVLQSNIDAEASARAAADSALDTRVTALESVQAPVWAKEKFSLTATDISNGYVDLANLAIANSIHAFIDRLAVHEGAGEDFTVSEVSSVTRITFEAGSPFAEGDNIYVRYQY